jgi:hypothetical protein
MLKSRFEKNLEIVCEKYGAKWRMGGNGTITFTREGFRGVEYKVYISHQGVDLERENEKTQLREPLVEHGLEEVILNMSPERWRMCSQVLAYMAILEEYPVVEDWKLKINPNLRSLLEAFPEYERGEGMMTPSPSYWMAVSDLGWARVPAVKAGEQLLHGNVEDDWVKAQQEFAQSVPLGLPLPEGADAWTREAQSRLLTAWLKEDATRFLSVWELIEPDMLRSSMSRLEMKGLDPLVDLLRKMKASDPDKYRLIARRTFPVWAQEKGVN